MSFDIAKEVDHQITVEGEYSDDPNDSGGKTKFGVTEVVARSFGYEGEMIDMTREVAVRIFTERYYFQPHFDWVVAVDERIGRKMLEIGINMGQARSARMLQRALNVLNRQAKDFPDIEPDGNVGKMTIYCLRSFLERRGPKGQTVLLRMLNGQQTVKYMEFSEAKESQERFTFGWIGERVDGFE